MAIWAAPPIWQDGTCFILGGGPSLLRQFNVPEKLVQEIMANKRLPHTIADYFSSIQAMHCIGINNAYKLGNWIEVLFFGDCGWYNVYRFVLARLSILKVTCCDRFAKPDKLCDGIKYQMRDRQKPFGISNDPTKVCWNNNSGAAAISLAAHFGVKRIFLLGFDMCSDEKRITHWHGSHHPKDTKKPIPPYERHKKGFPFIAADAKEMGIEIINCSPVSTLTEFPKISIKEALQEIQGEKEVKSVLSAVQNLPKDNDVILESLFEEKLTVDPVNELFIEEAEDESCNPYSFE